MYFSRIELSKTSPKLFKVLEKIGRQNGYHLHQLIWTLFADPKRPSKQRDFLYRQENQGHWPTFYILSRTKPADTMGIWIIQSKPYQPQITIGENFYFSLRANPRIIKNQADGKKIYCDAVMDLKKHKGSTTTTYELIQEAANNWLNKRCAGHGFKLIHASAEGYQQHKFAKPYHLIQFSTLDYAGVLEVTDTSLFLNTLQTGIGAAKGFGCGLMLIRRS